MMHLSAALLLLAACGRPIEDADVKMAGVGYNPDDIGPEPEYAGGYVEYDLVDFAGGALTLGALGLILDDEIGPGLLNMTPPYSAIYGLGFIFDDLVPGPDAHHSSITIPPPVEDTCWTIYEPFSFLLASPVDVGTSVTIASDDGETAFTLGRFPEIYPPDPQDVFVYYIGVESWVANPLSGWAPTGGTDPAGMAQQVLRPVNFSFGAPVRLSFPGGLPPVEAPVSSIPVPSSAVVADALTTPTPPEGVMLSWNGVRYDGRGNVVADAGANAACLSYLEGDAPPTAPDDCLVQPAMPDDEVVPGQIYTGPWDTTDGAVTFRWKPGAGQGEEVFLNVRFLAPLDPYDENNIVGKVPVEATADVSSQWDLLLQAGEVTGDLPQGYRDPLACTDRDGVQWIPDPTLFEGDGSPDNPPRRHLRGDPFSNLVEVSCRLADDGSFVLTQEMLADAFAYLDRKEAQGAIFFFGRATEQDVQVPDVRDQAGLRREVSPVIFRSHAVKVGRFWWNQ